MRRYDFERYENRYYIFDRQLSTTHRIAIVFDVADAEMICNALNNAMRIDTRTNPRRW
jgi:hypothetical protein